MPLLPCLPCSRGGDFFSVKELRRDSHGRNDLTRSKGGYDEGAFQERDSRLLTKSSPSGGDFVY